MHDGQTPLRGFRFKHGDRPLEGYTIQRAAGRGGFGEVYYAVSDSGREVALKYVQAYEQIELRGISQCMNLKSPHLVTIFDVRFGTNGEPFVIMEYVNGSSLRDLIDQSPVGLGTQKSAFFLREIAKGLTYLHDCGIVHRDLKPGNIFYENGTVKIGDYGLSKAITTGQHSAQTVTVGTVHYMAPEIGAGKYDRSIDIYALGALLFEMLSGQVPFFGASPAEVLMKHLTAPLPLDGIEEPFATAIRRSMAKDPAERFQSVQEMVEAVFGAEHVRQSVSVFSPDSLTMVAGRVARHAIGAHPSDAAGAFDPSTVAAGAASPTLFDRLGQRVAAVGNRMTRIGGRLVEATRCKKVPGALGRGAERIKEIGRGIRGVGGAKPQAAVAVAPAAPAPLTGPKVDPLPGGQRFLLTLIATAAVSIGAGVLNPEMREPMAGVLFVFLYATGAGFGIRWASRHWLPALKNEPRILRHLAMGSPAAVLGVILAMIVAGPEERLFRHLGQTIGAICVAMLIVDWPSRTDPKRSERMSLSDVIYAAVPALITSIVMQGDVMLTIGVLAATCMAAQVGSPWVRKGVRAAVETEPVQSESAVRPMVPPAPPEPPAPPVAPRPFEATSAAGVAVVSEYGRQGVSIVRRFMRFVLSVVGLLLLLAALAGSLTLAYDLPGVMAVGGFGPEAPREMTREFGTPGWPSILRAFIAVGVFLVALLAATVFLLLRRPKGGIHMLRAAAGIFLILWAPFVLFTGMKAMAVEGAFPPNGWVITEMYLGQIQATYALRAAVVLFAGVVLLVWPAKPRGVSKGASGSNAAAVQSAA